MTEWLTDMNWVNGLLGQYIDNVFILSKIVVAVLVALFWNYHMQRLFVYKNHHIIKRLLKKCNEQTNIVQKLDNIDRLLGLRKQQILRLDQIVKSRVIEELPSLMEAAA